MIKEDRADLGLLVILMLEPKMVKEGIIPDNFDWKNITEEQKTNITNFVKKELEIQKEKKNARINTIC